MKRRLVLATALASALAGWVPSRAADDAAELGGSESARSDGAIPPGTRVLRDRVYGRQAGETLDIYIPVGAHAAPVLFMVHGGGWRRGDKDARKVVGAKVAHWLPQGYVFISTNYPLLPAMSPLGQARAVGRALAMAQRNAARWGADPAHFILMGHSAGAQLVALLATDPALVHREGAQPWLGTIALDSAAYDVAALMRSRHAQFYAHAFGHSPRLWATMSPLARLQAPIAPFLAVCSSLRADSCDQARVFVAKARRLGSRAELLPVALRHGQIDGLLGLPSAYTVDVDQFITTLGVPGPG